MLPRLPLASPAAVTFRKYTADGREVTHLGAFPKGETIRRLMEKHNISSACYIGDTQGDLEASRMAGLPFVFCRFGFGAPEEYDYAVDSFPQLLELF